MPLKDIDSKGAIDELYKKYSGDRTDYITLRTELEIINKMILNQAANVYYDSSEMTYAAANRKDKELAGVEKRFEKDRLYGIVLYTLDRTSTHVYIDVPGKTSPMLDPDIFYTEPELELSKYKEYLFEADSADYLSIPVVGGIASVKVPYNFPEHVYTNPEDAVFLNMKRPDILVTINDAAQSARVPLTGFGGLGIVNSTAAAPLSVTPSYSGEVLPSEPTAEPFAGELASFVDKKYILQAHKECKIEHPRLTRLAEKFPNFPKEARDMFLSAFTKGKLTKQDIKYINEAAAYYGFDPDIILTIGAIETMWGFYPRLYSDAGAVGYIQVMPMVMQDVSFLFPHASKAQGWLKKLSGVTDVNSAGETIPVITTKDFPRGKKTVRLLIVDESFRRKNKSNGKSVIQNHAIDLNLPKFREIALYYAAFAINNAITRIKERGVSDDLFLVAASYNGGPGSAFIQLEYKNYRNIASWNLSGLATETHKYMMKFHVVYSLIKCAKKAAKAAESAATPVS